MAAKVFESIGKFGLALAVAGGVVNSALYNGEILGGEGVLLEDFSWCV
jgi:prohibitin 1